ncbi:hypothetical protein EHQ12_09455 [Leptospira gomenensis]|uniref:Uncharacterized protein n=1 Tax=Leptospira gomenensis TaxID=2484974 RepID=A0A5F1YX47_9LEPT|nr:hypothetical protein [Leptospira gomenensis]TGK38354.1 hypothetical protein EHQ17_01520 [Leptospira gomenensis]TGK39274.1 hypothetical protein EHQ12_09455 [Leptospira gomenensis]TGK52168.1 hypothetical protein EHQ07_00945 [Leptospira gomenensis]TGK62978.1 hypothetical protein EHQ13_08040 [Leptospira gomenensis]
MTWIGKMLRLRRGQKQRIFNKAYRQALKLMKKEFKAERDRHLQAEKELEKYYRKDVDTEAKKTRKKIQELDNFKLLLERREMELDSKLVFLNEQLQKIEELKARMDGAVNLMARAGSLSNGAIDDAEKIKQTLKKVF